MHAAPADRVRAFQRDQCFRLLVGLTDAAGRKRLTDTILTEPTADGTTHVEWAAGIARRIAKFLGHKSGSQEQAEIVAHALYTVVRKLEQFAPQAEYGDGESCDGHFRGWLHISLRAECVREAKRLLGGGTFHTPPDEERAADGEPKKAVRVEELPTRRTESGVEEVEIKDHRAPEPSPDFLACCRGFQKRKIRYDTTTGEPIAEPEPPPLSYPADERPAFAGLAAEYGMDSEPDGDSPTVEVVPGAGAVPPQVAPLG